MANSPIEHVLFLLLENRSFDHMLGFLPREGHLAEFDGLTGKESNLLNSSDRGSQRIAVRKGAPYKVTTGRGPAHSFLAANVQVCGDVNGPCTANPARNNGFVQSYLDELKAEDGIAEPTADQIATVMECFTPEQMPAISTLAQNFHLCERWFSSVPGPTQPNRLYAQAATSAGWTYNYWAQPFDFRTIYNSLEDAGKSWCVYYSNDNEALRFTQLKKDHARFRHFEDRFVSDVQSGNLPNYSYIIPRFMGTDVVAANSEHPPLDVRYGEQLLATIYNALAANEKLFAKTLFIVTYDEHGGFYDHVVPPSNVPNPDGLSSPLPGQGSEAPSFDFTRLGVRVPAILVSPRVMPTLDSTVYDHTSTLATLKKLWGLPSFLTERDANANSFEQLIMGDLPLRNDLPEKLPVPPLPNVAEVTKASQVALDDIQRSLISGSHTLHPDPAKHDPSATHGIKTQADAAEYMDRMIKLHLDHHDARK